MQSVMECWAQTGDVSPDVGTAVAERLRCCATNRKVAGSIPDGVIGIFHWYNPSDRTMALVEELQVPWSFRLPKYPENSTAGRLG